jgi:hypothetical protein
MKLCTMWCVALGLLCVLEMGEVVLSSVIVVPTSVSKDPNQDSIISTASSLDTVQPTPVVTSKPKYPCSTPWSGNEW